MRFQRWERYLEPEELEDDEKEDEDNSTDDGTVGAPEVFGVEILCAFRVFLRLRSKVVTASSDVAELCRAIQDVVDTALHDLVDVLQIGGDLVQVALRLCVHVELLCLLNERVCSIPS